MAQTFALNLGGCREKSFSRNSDSQQLSAQGPFMALWHLMEMAWPGIRVGRVVTSASLLDESARAVSDGAS